MPKINLESFETYEASILDYIHYLLLNHYKNNNLSLDYLKRDLEEINKYSNFDYLEPVSKDSLHLLWKEDTKYAEKAILNGEVLWEHAAAGEATRLGLGTKYLLNLSNFNANQILDHIRKDLLSSVPKYNEELYIKGVEEIERTIEKEFLPDLRALPPISRLIDLSLGNRHMLQLAFEITRIAKKHNFDYNKALKNQTILMVLNEQTAEEILNDFIKFNFFGFARNKTYFMIQRAFHGIDIKEKPYFDKTTDKNKRLHNHGQMVMQKHHDRVIFKLDDNNNRIYLSYGDVKVLIKNHKDMISYNIEDLSYLTHAIDLHSLAKALELGNKGYNMVMEIVAQNPKAPQKGGAAFFDSKLNRIVMIESHQLKGIKNEDLKFLNKNFNHYPNPLVAFEAVANQGLPITLAIKKMFDQDGQEKDYVYPTPVQGDINFLVNTAFIIRKDFKPIKSWKRALNNIEALQALFAQDNQEGFKEFIREFTSSY